MPADGTQIKQDIDTNLAGKGYRGVRVFNIITALKAVVDWVAGAINGNVATWNKVGTSGPAASNADDVYRMGKVGIGLANPSQQVEVAGSVAFSGYVVYRNGGVDAAYIGNGSAMSGASSDLGFRAETGRLIFATSGGSQRMVVTTTGNIGIGLNTPAEKLHVAGNIQSDGFIRAGSGNKAFKITGVKTGTGLTLRTTRYLELTLEDGTIVKVAEVN